MLYCLLGVGDSRRLVNAFVSYRHLQRFLGSHYNLNEIEVVRSKGGKCNIRPHVRALLTKLLCNNLGDSIKRSGLR